MQLSILLASQKATFMFRYTSSSYVVHITTKNGNMIFHHGWVNKAASSKPIYKHLFGHDCCHSYIIVIKPYSQMANTREVAKLREAYLELLSAVYSFNFHLFITSVQLHCR